MRSFYAVWSRVRLAVGWTKKKRIRVHRAYAQRHVGNHRTASRSDKAQTSSKSIPSVYYKKNSCMRKATHETKGVLYSICSSCWSKDGNQFAHPHSDCRKSQGQSNKRVKMGTPIYRPVPRTPTPWNSIITSELARYL